MRRRAFCLFGGTAVLLLALCGVASADVTLGSTTQPSGSSEGTCFPNSSNSQENDALVQLTDTSVTPYTVPQGGETIKEWGTNTTGDTPGTPLTLVILRPAGANYTVVGVDAETLPNRLFSDQDSVFMLARPIVANAADKLGLYSSASGSNTPPICYFGGGSTPDPFGLDALAEPSSPAAGQSLSEDMDQGPSGPNFMLDVAVNQNQDASVSTTAGPSTAATHRTAVLASTVTNGGPTAAAITFTDRVPARLTIDSAVAAQGTCTTGGQTVTCTIDGLTAGQSAPVDVLVTPTTAGRYINDVSVTSSVLDPNASNNTASARLTASSSASGACVVPNLKGASSKLAKRVLKDLGCKVKTARQHSKHVRKGDVIKTKPGTGTHAGGTTVRVVVSSGRGRAKHRKHSARAAYLSYGAVVWQR
jgi:hypothetical protein